MGKIQGPARGPGAWITWGVAYLGSEAKLWVVGMVFPGELESRGGSGELPGGTWGLGPLHPKFLDPALPLTTNDFGRLTSDLQVAKCNGQFSSLR